MKGWGWIILIIIVGNAIINRDPLAIGLTAVLLLIGIVAVASSTPEQRKEWAQQAEQRKQERKQMKNTVPHTTDLVYPAELPYFRTISDEGHRDHRALVYTILSVGWTSSGTFTYEELSAGDFDSKREACQILEEKGLIQEQEAGKVLVELYGKDELKALLKDRGLHISGGKQELANRLIENGFKIDRRKYRKKLYILSARGKGEITQYIADKAAAIDAATLAAKEADYYGAISAYREYDKKWGFVHASGKRHTIFAHYDVPFERFDFLARYPMRELRNTDDFRRALRACLIAGLMRGCMDRSELADYFQRICGEQISCPNIVKYYERGVFNGESADEDTIAAMRENAKDSRYVLEYYISRVLYLSRQSTQGV